jgi:hypothetical protein
MKTFKTSLVLLSSIFVLAACGQKASNGSTTETTQAAQATTAAPTTQANNKPSENQSSDNKQSNANSNQQSNSAIPKDGEAVYKRVKNGRTTTIKYYFKDDIVYLQEAVYAYNHQTLGKSEEETQQIVKKRHAIYNGVKGIESTVEHKDGIYYLTINVDYKNVDWKELHKRAPETHPDDNPPILKYSEVVPKLRENGYVKQ